MILGSFGWTCDLNYVSAWTFAAGLRQGGAITSMLLVLHLNLWPVIPAEVTFLHQLCQTQNWENSNLPKEFNLWKHARTGQSNERCGVWVEQRCSKPKSQEELVRRRESSRWTKIPVFDYSYYSIAYLTCQMMHQVWKNEHPNHAEQLPEKHDPLYAGGQSGNINIYYKLPTPDTETSN